MALFLAFLLAGCADPREKAATAAASHGWAARTFPTQHFDIATWAVGTFVPGQPLNVYVEGDGLAFLSATRVSDDPTPRTALALQLALRDPRPNVVYIARPCQFVSGSQRRNCHYAYWTYARYSEAAIASIDAVVDAFKAQARADSVRLYGYSGGGAIVALLAARRSDVAMLTTIAGVLDHATWTGLDGMTPLSDSLNPADYHAALARVPQLHYVGADDKVVPPAVARAFQSRFPGTKPRIVTIAADHECCWVDLWPSLMRTE